MSVDSLMITALDCKENGQMNLPACLVNLKHYLCYIGKYKIYYASNLAQLITEICWLCLADLPGKQESRHLIQCGV